jgi:Concanavalin A-like lectin/glucanases superfamily
VGSVQTDTAISKFLGSSIVFDGLTAALDVASDTRFGFGTGDFTLECWLYPEGTAQNRTLFDFRTGSTTDAPVVFQNANTLRYFSTTTRITISTGYTADTWHHVALCRKNGVTNLYLNGTPGTPYTDATDYGTTAPLVIGSSYLAANFLFGNVAEIRITKGFAQYDGAFPVPVAPFLDTSPVTAHPELMLQWSDDAGHTWCQPVTGAIGAEGDYTRRVIFRRLGRSWRRTWKLRVSDPVKIAIIAATVKTA